MNKPVVFVCALGLVLSMGVFSSSFADAKTATSASLTPTPTPRVGASGWNFKFPIDAKGNPLQTSGPTPNAFGYGICKGTFQPLTKQSRYLVWGAQSTCTASNNFFYLHRVRVDLYDTCLYGLCIFFEKTKSLASPSSSNYSRVATVNGHDYCKGVKDVNSRTYEQRVYVTIRDIDFGPFAQQVGVQNCDIKP
jgi:hypothetical protein